MAARTLQQGIDAIRQGHLGEGSRYLRIALQDQNLPPNLKAIAFMWLAQTTQDHDEQVQYYQQAVQADPNNTAAQQGLSTLLAPQPPTPPNHTPSPNTNNEPPRQPTDTGPLPRQTGYQSNPNREQQRGTPNYRSNDGSNQQPNPPPNQGQQVNYNPYTQQAPQQPQPRDPNNFGRGNNQPPVQSNADPFGPPNSNQPYDPNNFSASTAQDGRRPDQRGYGRQASNNPAQSAPNDGFEAFGASPPPNNSNDPFPQFDPRRTTSDFVPANAGGGGNQDQPIILREIQRSVGIVGGPNGQGTGFFVTSNGIIATTRYIIGGEEQVEVQLLDGRPLVGHVVRSFPELDLAFVQTNVQLERLMTPTRNPSIPDNTPLIAIAHPNKGLRSSKRATRQVTAPHWFPTLINHLQDSGGNPIFTEGQEHVLVGMLTKNLARSNGYMYGLHIMKIREMLQVYGRELQERGQSSYCFKCGAISHAPQFGGFYCERCGSTLSYAMNITRYPQPNLVGLYGENDNRPCPNCDSTVGFHKGLCLRCGYKMR